MDFDFDYSLEIKTQRLDVVRRALMGGELQLFGEDQKLLGRIALDADCGAVIADLLYFTGFPKYAMAEGAGKVRFALLVGKDGSVVASNRNISDQVSRPEVSLNNIIRVDKLEIRHG